MIPFWGHYQTDNGFRHLENWQAFHHFEIWARENWHPTSIDQADVAILPFDGSELLHQEGQFQVEIQAIAQRFVDRANSMGLRTIVVVRSDSIDPLPLGDSTIVLRHSLNCRTRRQNEYSLYETFHEFVPAQSADTLMFRPWHEVPVVGFCGFAASAPPPFRQRLKRATIRRLGQAFGHYIPDKDGIYLRHKAIELLKRAQGVDTNFVIRDKLFFGSTRDQEAHTQLRQSYTSNMLDSDYVLSIRGWGNHSVRFFEAMSLGRTPVLVDTDCVLPYDFLHGYGELCVIVPAAKIEKIDQYVREHHSRFTQETYIEQQQKIRRFWENWLSPQGFCEHLAAHWEASPRAALSPKHSCG